VGAGLRMMITALLAGSVPVRAEPFDELLLAADEPMGVWINDQYMSLAITTGTVDHTTLNDDVVQPLGLVAARRDNIANLMIGGVVARFGRHGRGQLTVTDRSLRREMFWFPGTSALPENGTIGPHGLPHQTVTVTWRTGAAAKTTAYSWPLIGGVDSAAYGVSHVGDRVFVIGADVRTRRRLPLVTAATGVDLAEVLGGRLVGPPWPEEIMLGIRRPVRRLQLDKPLVIGPLRFDAVAVRVGGAREGSMWLAPGQKPLREIDEDPAEALVRGRTARQRPVSRIVLLSRNQLEDQGCVSLTVAKRERKFLLDCAVPDLIGADEPARPAAVSGNETEPVPLLPAHQAVPVLGTDGWLEIPVDARLTGRILGTPVELMLGSGSLAGVVLNAATAERIGLDVSAREGRVTFSGEDSVPFAVTQTGVHIAGRSSPQMVGWVPGAGSHAGDGLIDMTATPFQRIRVRLRPETTGSTVLQFPAPVGELGASTVGRVPQGRIAGFDIAADVRERWPLPLVSAALAVNIVARLGGQLQGQAWEEQPAFGVKRRVRQLVLAKPWLLGPLRFDRLAVQVERIRDGTPRLKRRLQRLPDADPNSEDIVVLNRTASRLLHLSRTQLEQQRCSHLGIDMPGRIFELMCAGPDGLGTAGLPAPAHAPAMADGAPRVRHAVDLKSLTR
jgi:hypothetical protein